MPLFKYENIFEEGDRVRALAFLPPGRNLALRFSDEYVEGIVLEKSRSIIGGNKCLVIQIDRDIPSGKKNGTIGFVPLELSSALEFNNRVTLVERKGDSV